MMAASRRWNSGFTIVELLVVVVVIGILAAITIVSFNGVISRAHETAVRSDVAGAVKTFEIYQISNNSYPSDCTTIDVKVSANNTFACTSTLSSYCVAVTYNSIVYHATSASPTPVSGDCPIIDMQTIASASCPASRTVVADARDGRTYWIKQMGDGKCWMLTNLAYAGGGTNTYGDVKTLTNGTGGSSSYTVASYYVPTGSNPTSKPTLPSTSTTGTGQYGYMYNWCGAMGGQATAACSNLSTPTPDTTATVCPAGWRLPTGGPGGEFIALNTAVNSSSTTSDSGILTNWLGMRTGDWYGGFAVQGTEGYYWSSTQASSTNAYRFGFQSNSVTPQNTTNKGYGRAVRCIVV